MHFCYHTQTMKIRFWGTRGSIPAPGPSTVRYGGNTSCVEVRLADGTMLILDAGSGIRPLGAAVGPCQAHLLLTHYHWDHIQGMPFFGPVYAPQSSIHIYGPEYEGKGPDHLLAGQMMAPYFPAPAASWSGVSGYDVVRDRDCLSLGSAMVRVGRLSHPGVTYGYRIEDDGCTVAYLSDDEPDVASPEQEAAIAELAEGAGLLIHDCQYNELEYAPRHYWGHSTPRQATRIATEAGVGTLMLFHHDPGHSDEQVEVLAEEARGLAGDYEVLIAREGATITLGETSERSAVAL